MVAVGTVYGCVRLLDVSDELNLCVLAKYNLTSTKIVGLKLIPNSSYFTAIDDQNYQFLMKRQRFGSNGDGDDDDDNVGGIRKITSLPSGHIDYSAIEMNDGTLHILLLFVKNDSNEMNSRENLNHFAQYIQIQTASDYGHQIQTILLNQPYNAMKFQYFDTQRFVVAAKLTDIHALELIPCDSSGGKIEMNLKQTITTAHSIGCSIQFTVNAASILTYGSDGQCLLWDKNSMRMVKSILAHNKCRRGVKAVVLDSMQR